MLSDTTYMLSVPFFHSMYHFFFRTYTRNYSIYKTNIFSFLYYFNTTIFTFQRCFFESVWQMHFVDKNHVLVEFSQETR